MQCRVDGALSLRGLEGEFPLFLYLGGPAAVGQLVEVAAVVSHPTHYLLTIYAGRGTLLRARVRAPQSGLVGRLSQARSMYTINYAPT